MQQNDSLANGWQFSALVATGLWCAKYRAHGLSRERSRIHEAKCGVSATKAMKHTRQKTVSYRRESSVKTRQKAVSFCREGSANARQRRCFTAANA